ncbi:MAG: NUDIX hydrolase [Hyphomicrobiaceae bacterium]|nr:NUDIX hydrolase [Hyphomicrobiaceae bacterium]
MSRIVESVLHISGCDLRTADEPWPYARENVVGIDAAWAERIARHPHFFNGRVHLMRETAYRIAGGRLSGTLWATDFKSFAHWRDAGRGSADAIDCFGSIIMRSAEGHILLGRQRQGLNAGHVYLPGGVIDADDVRPGGVIDIERNIVRELYEELGLSPDGLGRVPGYLVTRSGPFLSIGAVFDTALPAETLRLDIRARLAADPEPELDDIFLIGEMADLEGHTVPPYTVAAVAYLLASRSA